MHVVSSSESEIGHLGVNSKFSSERVLMGESVLHISIVHYFGLTNNLFSTTKVLRYLDLELRVTTN